MLHSPEPISYLLQHIFLRFCPPPCFHDDKMGLEGLLTGQLVPFCCSKSGSTIMWEVLIQRALKIPQQQGWCDLSQSETLAGVTEKEQRRSERGKMRRSLPGKVKETSRSTRVRSQGDLSARPTWMSILHLHAILQAMSYLLALLMYMHYIHVHLRSHYRPLYTYRSHPSLHLCSTDTCTPHHTCIPSFSCSSPLHLY